MKKIDLKELQKIELDMLVYIDKICKKYNIKYYLACGTLLGAVKCQGFIPWDDDIDIYMLRDDYNKFSTVFDEEKSDYKFLTCFNTKDYYYVFGKVVDTRTKLLENSKEIKEMGVFVDIMPLDYYKSDVDKDLKSLRFLNNMAVKRYKIKNNIRDDFAFLKNSKEKKRYILLKKIIYSFIDIVTLPLGYNFYAKLFNKKCIGEKSDIVGFKGSHLPYKNMFPSSLLQETIKLKFENYEFPAFKDYDIYLKNKYGDYKKDPSLNEQITHHQSEVYYR